MRRGKKKQSRREAWPGLARPGAATRAGLPPVCSAAAAPPDEPSRTAPRINRHPPEVHLLERHAAVDAPLRQLELLQKVLPFIPMVDLQIKKAQIYQSSSIPRGGGAPNHPAVEKVHYVSLTLRIAPWCGGQEGHGGGSRAADCTARRRARARVW